MQAVVWGLSSSLQHCSQPQSCWDEFSHLLLDLQHHLIQLPASLAGDALGIVPCTVSRTLILLLPLVFN